MKTRRDQKIKELISRRTLILAGGKLTLFSILSGRLYYLQVIDSDKYKTLSENNQFNVELLPPIRGRILDRRGVLLALNKDNFRVEIIPERVKNIGNTLDKLGKIIEVDRSNLKRVLSEIKLKRSFVPIPVMDNLTWEEISSVAINTPYLPGIRVDVGRSRSYPFKESAVHITGYVAAVSHNEQVGDPLLELPDFRVGKSGIEKAFDKSMRGVGTQQQVEVNAFGRVVRRLPSEGRKIGNDVRLTIDMRLQTFLNQRLSEGNSLSMAVDDPRVIAAVRAGQRIPPEIHPTCLLYTSDAADE